MTNTVSPRIALLISCEALRDGVAAQFAKLDCAVVQSGHFTELQLALRVLPLLHLLMADQARLIDALYLGQEQHVPIAIISPTILNAFAVLDDRRLAGVVIPPLSRGLFADLLATTMAGGRYRPRLNQLPLFSMRFTRKEEELLQLRLQGHSIDEVSDLMHIDVETAVRYERRIRDRLERMENPASAGIAALVAS